MPNHQDVPRPPRDPNAEYLTIQETAYVLQCGVKYLRTGMNAGRFPHSRISRRIITNRADRDAIYQAMRVGPTPQPKRIVRQRRRPPMPRITATP